jgi:aminoglycoside phosphotransferase (APT) family kinase protein
MNLPSAEGARALGPQLGAGREADVYACGDSAVIKHYHPGFGGHRAEALALRALDRQSVAPKLIDIVDRDGRTGLVVERLAGPDMLTLVQRQPWRVLALGRLLAQAHLAVHRIQAPAELAGQRQILAARIGDADLPRNLLDFTTRMLDGLPDGDRLCHGDYHPGNVLLAADRTAVIDWGAATRGVPEADHARTLLLLRWADPLPGTPLPSRALIARTYRRGSSPLRETRSWLIVHAAARLSEGIPAERDMLIGRLENARRKDHA